MRLEEWRAIPSIPNYEASSFGNIRRIGKISSLKKPISKQGYARIKVRISGKTHTLNVCHLVAEAFLGKRPTDHHIHHKDSNKINDIPENLEYMCKWKHYTTFTVCAGSKHGNHKLSELDVVNIRRMYPDISIKKLSIIYGVKYNTIQKVVNRRGWTHI